MTSHYFLQPSGRLAALAIALWASAAQAQTAPVAPTLEEKAPRAQAATASFQSALDGYKPYTDETTGNWKEANDLTARIGGWRAYAKEASEPETETPVPAGKRGTTP